MLKKIISFLLCVIMLLLVCAGFSGCWGNNVIKLGINQYFVPMTYDENGDQNYRGYVIEVMTEAAKRMGMKFEANLCTVGQRSWFMGQGDINCIWEVHEENDFDYTWSDPLFNSSIVCVVPESSPVQEVAFEKAKLGVRNNSYETQALSLILDKLKSCEFTGGNAYPEIFEELDQGITSAVIMERNSAEYFVAKSGGKYRILDDSLLDCPYAVGFKLGNTELCNKFNKAMQEMQADGTAKTISEKWFGKDITQK